MNRDNEKNDNCCDVIEKIEIIADLIKNELDVEKLLGKICEKLLDIFQCDRAWLLFPCDPRSAYWQVPIERTVPEFPGAKSMNLSVEMTPDTAEIFQAALESKSPLIYGPKGLPLAESTKNFEVKSQISMAIYPRVGKPWQFGLHQCSHERVWKEPEIKFFQLAGTMTAEALGNLLLLRDLQKTNKELEERVTERTSALQQQIEVRKEVEKGLFESRMWLSKMFHSLEDAVLIVTPDRKLVDINLATEKIFGYTKRELREFTTEILHVDNGHYLEFGRRVEEAFEKGEVASFEFKLKRKNGEIFPTRHTVSLLKNDAGEPLGVVSVVRDISEQKKAAAALAESEYRFRQVFNRMSNGVAIYEAADNGNDFIFKDINPAGAINGQVERDEIIGRSVVDVFPGVVDMGLFEVFQRVWRTNMPELYPTSLYTDHRVKLWVENFVFKLPSGEVVAVYDDITKRKQYEEALALAKNEWEKTFDSMDDIVTIQDKDMRIIRANKAAFDTFDVTPEELIGKHCYEIFRGTNFPCPNCPELETLKDKQTHSQNISYDELNKIFHVTSSPILDERDELSNIVHVAKDITEHKKMEEELFQAHKMEAIGTLAGGIAHDFNNILAAIIGYADIVRLDTPVSSPSRKDIDKVIAAGNRAKDLVKQILTFSRKGQEIQQPMEPAVIIKEALKLMRASLPTTIDIQEDIDPDCGVIVANPTNVHQVLVNLCTNALHAMEKEKGILTVKLKPVKLSQKDVRHEPGPAAGKFVELMVSDTGCGMDKEVAERIFDPYFTTKEIGKGSGMGLALVHGIVKNCAGFIRVESEPGQGSTFYIYFPAVKGQTAKNKTSQNEVLPKGNERILAVDDEEVIAGLYKASLQRLGYTVTTHTSSEEALATFKAAPDSFDLVLTDQTMPRLSGSELAKKILAIRPDIPIILCTGYSSMVSEEKAKKIGLAGFTMKPVNRKKLAIIVRKVLDELQRKD